MKSHVWSWSCMVINGLLLKGIESRSCVNSYEFVCLTQLCTIRACLSTGCPNKTVNDPLLLLVQLLTTNLREKFHNSFQSLDKNLFNKWLTSPRVQNNGRVMRPYTLHVQSVNVKVSNLGLKSYQCIFCPSI